jgi:hypothetical protein
MRQLWVILCAAVVAGCAAHSERVPTEAQVDRVEDVGFEQARPASALVFDPPVAANQPPLELARAQREPSAFVAYDEVFSTYFYLRLDDRQKISPDGTSERRVISETFGVSRR